MNREAQWVYKDSFFISCSFQIALFDPFIVDCLGPAQENVKDWYDYYAKCCQFALLLIVGLLSRLDLLVLRFQMTDLFATT